MGWRESEKTDSGFGKAAFQLAMMSRTMIGKRCDSVYFGCL